MNRRSSDERESFEQLVRLHGGRIRRIGRRFAAPAAVDDLVQDILVRMWRSYPGFRGEAKLVSWIYRIALNAAMTCVSEAVRSRNLQAPAALCPPVAARPTCFPTFSAAWVMSMRRY